MPDTSGSVLQQLLPLSLTVSIRERLYGVIGALLGLLICERLGHQLLTGFSLWFIAPMGASAVLLFAAPATPMAQPWPMFAGNVVSGVIGIACAKTLGISGLTAALASGLAIAAMFALRCLHPPGGAVSVTAVLGGEDVNALGWELVTGPILTNSLTLLVVALLFNNLLRRRYPHRSIDHSNQHHTSDPLPSQRLGFNHADLDAVLAARGEVLDISKDDLEDILIAAELHAYKRRFGNVRCQDIMSRDVVSISVDATAQEAWAKLARHKVKALPVVGNDETLRGIISLHDFFIGHDNLPLPLHNVEERQTRTVGQLMTENVAIARPEQPIAELVKLFSDAGLHHLPVVNAQRHVVGMITQSDMVAALFAIDWSGKWRDIPCH